MCDNQPPLSTSFKKKNVIVKLFFTIVGVVILIIMSGKITAVHPETKQLNIAYADSEQPPYIYGIGMVIPQNPGAVVDMIKMLEQKIHGLQINLSRLPWKRCLEYLKSGQVDGIFNASFTQKRLKNGAYPMKDGQPDPSKRLVTISYGIYSLKNSSITWDGKTFRNLNGVVGVNRGFSVVSELEKMGVPFQEVNLVSQNLKKLKLGRIAAVLAQDVTANALLKDKERFEGIVKLRTPFATKPYYLMLSYQFIKKYPTVAEQIWTEIKEIRKFEFDDLVAKYAEE
ncbi:MAG: transporter substrate-binding domain-containing protein [Desulfobacterales bacterium]|nr:transporter substrate-binding domain-containing protein [Desulfobacterales bacterium]